jgi:hypothetical protein
MRGSRAETAAGNRDFSKGGCEYVGSRMMPSDQKIVAMLKVGMATSDITTKGQVSLMILR